MEVGGFVSLSLIDYPRTRSAVVFTMGCNFCCDYCHNASLQETVAGTGRAELIMRRIEALKAKDAIEGVVLTGGEPLLHEDTPDFVKKLKARGLKVKLDTNGAFPHRLERALPDLDYVAIDYKATAEEYGLLKKGALRVSEKVCIFGLRS